MDAYFVQKCTLYVYIHSIYTVFVHNFKFAYIKKKLYLCTRNLCIIIMANTRQEIIDELKQLLESDTTATLKEQVDRLKTQFYTVTDAVVDGAEEGVNNLEEQFKELLSVYKAKRAEEAAAQAKEEAENLEKKQAILEQMKTMVEGADADDVMANLQKMRDLQAEWKKVGAVPAPQVQPLRKAYQQYQEQFYDLVKINIVNILVF